MDARLPDWSSSFHRLPFEGAPAIDSFKLATLFLILFIASSPATALEDLEIEERTSQTIYEQGDLLNFTTESGANTTFSVNITKNSEIAKFNLGIIDTYNESNETFYVYSRVHELNNSKSGILHADLWKNGTWKDNLSFRKADDSPTIIDFTGPSLVFVNETITVSVGVADSEEDVNSSIFRLEEDEYSMDQTGSRDNFQEFETNFSIAESGGYDYNLTVSDISGLETFKTGSFKVYSEPESDSSTVNITVNNRCLNYTRYFEVPGEGPKNLITRNATGAFLAEFVNLGSLPHRLNVSLDVTNESNNSWDPGEDIGNLILSYDSKDGWLNQSKPFNYYRRFEAVYPEGNYTGRLHVNSTCSDKDENDTPKLDFNMTGNFRILGVKGSGQGYRKGDQTTNQTTEANTTQTGEESDETVSGDANRAGTTPEPQPEPEPQPRPDPRPLPMLSVNMQTAELKYSAPRGRFREVVMNVTNYANVSVQDVLLDPMLDELPGIWQGRTASLAEINSSEKVQRSVYIQPGTDVQPGTYSIPVVARVQAEGRAIDIEYIRMRVKSEIFRSNISIAEVPRAISLPRNSTRQLPILIKNTGTRPVRNVSLNAQNLGNCGKIVSSDIDSIEVNETATLDAHLNSGDSIEECQTLFVVSTARGAFAFADVQVSVKPREGIVPPEFRVPLIASAWTAVLVLYAVLTRFYSLESLTVKLPFIFLIMGESVIFLYLATQYYGILPPGLLPF